MAKTFDDVGNPSEKALTDKVAQAYIKELLDCVKVKKEPAIAKRNYQSNKMNTNKSISPTWKLIIAILICESTGIISGLIANPGINSWFDTLNKPLWNPPAFLFAPVWTLLYLLMGISLWLIWKSNTPAIKTINAIILFAFQLFLNFWWSIIFFKFHSLAFALVDIILMLNIILFTIISFSKKSKLAAWLLVPYIAWVSFATILNYTIWILNK